MYYTHNFYMNLKPFLNNFLIVTTIKNINISDWFAFKIFSVQFKMCNVFLSNNIFFENIKQFSTDAIFCVYNFYALPSNTALILLLEHFKPCLNVKEKIRISDTS